MRFKPASSGIDLESAQPSRQDSDFGTPPNAGAHLTPRLDSRESLSAKLALSAPAFLPPNRSEAPSSEKNTGTVVVTSRARARKLHANFIVRAMQPDAAHLWQLALKNAMAEADLGLGRRKIETPEAARFHRIHAFAPGPDALE